MKWLGDVIGDGDIMRWDRTAIRYKTETVRDVDLDRMNEWMDWI